MLSIRINPNLAARLRTLAKKTGRTQSSFAQMALEEKIGDYEKAFSPVVEEAQRDPVAVQKALAELRKLRSQISKPEDMTIKEMIEDGRD